MKKIITFIISTIIIFSSSSYTFAEEWYISDMLDLKCWVELHNLDNIKLNNISFQNQEYVNVYNDLKSKDQILKNEFIKKCRNWDYSYYEINGIVSRYKNFIYSANSFFLLLKIEEQNPNYDEIDVAITRSFTNMKNNFKKFKNMVKSTY